MRIDERLARLVGSTPGDLLGTPAADWWPELARSNEDSLDSPPSGRLATSLRVDGEERLILFEEHPLLGPDDTVEGSLVVFRDATEELQLRERDQQFRALLTATPDVMLVLDRRGVYRHVFSTGLERLVAPPDQLLGKAIHEMLPPEPAREVQRVIDLTLSTGRVREYEYELVIQGHRTIFEARVVPFRIDDEEMVLWVARDITESRLAQEEQERFHAHMFEAQKLESLGVLAGGIAHDFNNLLVGITGNVSLALEDLPEDSPLRASLQEIEHTAESAAHLCDQMLAYAGRQTVLRSEVDLNAVVRDAGELVSTTVRRTAHLEWELAAGLMPVEGDATQLLQVALNLLTNASEAIQEPPGEIRVRTGAMSCSEDYLSGLRFGAEARPGPYVYFEVEDDGAGMAPETVQRLFEPFFSTKFAGRGLGMAAVLGIVRAHHGALQVQSRQGKGTTVRVLLPVVEVPAESRAGGADLRASTHEVVLVVDDEERVLSITSTILARVGYEVLVASDGRAAIRLAEEAGDRLGCAVVDATMPGLSGAETIEKLRELVPGLRIVLASGYPQGSEAVPGAHRFVKKPFKARDLREVVASELRLR